MERMTAEEAYREYRKLEVYDADDVDREIKRLREALDAAEKVVQAARGDQYGLESRIEEYDKLKEEK